MNFTICDTLSPFLDISSLAAGVSSHPYEVEILDPNLVKFYFNNIQLPDSETNPDASRGFIKFTTFQQPDNPPGTIILNQATLVRPDQSVIEMTNTYHHQIPDTLFIEQLDTVCRGELVNGIPILEDQIEVTGGTFTFGTVFRLEGILVIDPVYDYLFAEICEGEVFELDGQLYTETALYPLDTLEAANGCDSIRYLDLIVHPKTQQTISEVILEGDSISVGDNIYTESGTYINVLTDEFGCDSIVTLHLIVQPDEIVCTAEAGPDTLICGFEYTLSGQPGPGTWEVLCTGAPGLVELEPVDDSTSVATVTECGSYFFIYTHFRTDSLILIDSLTMDSTLILDTCLVSDIVQVDFEDPSSRNINVDLDMNLEYSGGDCAEGGEVYCSNIFDVTGEPLTEKWTFDMQGICAIISFEPEVEGEVNDCVADTVTIDASTSLTPLTPQMICTGQDAFADVDQVNDIILENDFPAYIDGLFGAGLDSLLSNCTWDYEGCFPPAEPCPDSTVYDTVELIVPIRLGGQWHFASGGSPLMPVYDTTHFMLNGYDLALVSVPGGEVYQTQFQLWELGSDNSLVAPDTTIQLVFQWLDEWTLDTLEWLVPIDLCEGCGGTSIDYNLGPIPDIPGHPCGPIAVTFGAQMYVLSSVINCNPNDYQVEVQIIGGLPPYSLTGMSGTWTGESSFLSDPIPIDQPYFATINDSGFCERDIAGDACPCAAPQAGSLSSVEMNCQDSCVTLYGNGSLSLSGTLEMQWLDINGETLSEEDSVVVCQPGYYRFLVTHAESGCTDLSFTEAFLDLPEAAAGPDQLITCNQTEATLQGMELSGVANVSYQWSGPGIPPGQETYDSITVMIPGDYELLVTNEDNGCTDTDALWIGIDQEVPVADAGTDQRFDCSGDPVLLDASGSAPLDSLIYTWTTIEGSIIGNPNAPIIEVQQPGSYTLVVEDMLNGCIAVDTVEVVPYEAIMVEWEVKEACRNAPNGAIEVVEVLEGLEPLSYSLDGFVFQDSGYFVGLIADTYELVIRDVDSCEITEIIEVPEIPVLPEINLAEEFHICGLGDTVVLDIDLGIAPEWVQYNWSNGATGPVQVLDEPGSYQVEVETECQNQVIDFTIVNDAAESAQLVIPNIFSPNRDGVNDTFGPLHNYTLSKYHLRVYNRWGQMIFQSENLSDRWDGMIGGKPAPAELYVYILHAALVDCKGDESEFNLRGDVTLLR